MGYVALSSLALRSNGAPFTHSRFISHCDMSRRSQATRLGVEGLVVLRTVPNSPAARAGLRGIDPNTGTLGDVIVAANGAPVHRLSDLTDQLGSVGVDHTIP